MLTIEIEREVVEGLRSEDPVVSHYSTQTLVAVAVNALLSHK